MILHIFVKSKKLLFERNFKLYNIKRSIILWIDVTTNKILNDEYCEKKSLPRRIQNENSRFDWPTESKTTRWECVFAFVRKSTEIPGEIKHSVRFYLHKMMKLSCHVPIYTVILILNFLNLYLLFLILFFWFFFFFPLL